MYDERHVPYDLKNTNFFKPLKLNDNITLEHRGVMPPLTRLRTKPGHILQQSTEYWEEDAWKQFIADPNNKTGEKKRGLSEEYYHQRSQKKGTLIVIEGTVISLQGAGSDVVPGIFNKEQIDSLSKVTTAIRDNGSFSIVQIVSLGRQADPEVLKKDGVKYLSSSANYIVNNDFRKTKEKAFSSGNLLQACTLDDIKELKKDFINAAECALKAGADGIELHAANGYMLNQFLDKKVNQRDDHYGTQTFENRSRLLLELFDEVAAKYGAEKVGIRVSPFNTMGDMTGTSDNVDTYAFYKYLYQQFENRRLNGNGPLYISLIEPRSDEISFDDNNEISNDFIFDIFKGVVMRAGNIILDNKFTKKIIDQNERTLIAMGRYFISNPDLIERLKNQWPINNYDRSTFYTDSYKGYIDYPYFKSTE